MKKRNGKRWARLLLGVALGTVLGGVQGAVDGRMPLLSLCRTAEAALWDGWFQEAPVALAFGEMYGAVSSLGIEFSDKLKAVEGRRVVMTGFMAPPLKPTIRFFVLTREPMSICPFCSSDADWPSDIVVVNLETPVESLPFDRPIRVTGKLALGTRVDEETGFVSLVRIQADALEAI